MSHTVAQEIKCRSGYEFIDPWKPDVHMCSGEVSLSRLVRGAVVAEWLSSWLAEQEVRGSIPRLAT